MRYVGRFAPSPTGPLHAGSLVAALASWLDARAAGGRWLVRIEDVDRPRCVPGMDRMILDQLARCGLQPDGDVVRQSQRGSLYQVALDRLLANVDAYPCACSRRDIEAVLAAHNATPDRHGERVYPGTCRHGTHGRAARAVRLSTDGIGRIDWTDRRLGPQSQDLAREVGDFVLRRADGLWAYQLAVVVDDAEQGITHVVRGEDLADNTPRQIHLQQRLGVATPTYLHTPLVLAADGQKLSKQNGAAALDLADPLRTLRAAGAVLGLRIEASEAAAWRSEAVRRWAARFPVVDPVTG